MKGVILPRFMVPERELHAECAKDVPEIFREG
jgi:hypothetical protein